MSSHFLGMPKKCEKLPCLLVRNVSKVSFSDFRMLVSNFLTFLTS